MKPFQKWIITILIVFVLLLVIFFPYLKAEVLTFQHGSEFEGLEQQTKMLAEARYYKVLSYTENTATVFYVSDTGDLITFRRDSQGNWQYTDWVTIWSNTGSADEFYWPYYH